MNQQLKARQISSWMRRGWRSQGGYTLTELVVLMGIMAILSGLVVANTKVGDKRQELRDAANQFVSTARQAESMAAASQDVKGSSRKAYGICVSVNTTQCMAAGTGTPGTHFLLYGRRSVPTVDSTYTNAPALTSNDLVSSFKLPSKVTFEPSAFWLDYLPPTPSLKLKGSDDTDGVLKAVTPGYEQNIRVRTKAGALYVGG